MKFSLNFVKDLLEVKEKPQDIAQLLTMAGIEVEHSHKEGDDFVFAIEITSNRYDWLSVVGIAREIGACLGKKLLLKYPAFVKKPAYKDKLIKIEDKKDCPFYVARVLRNVKVSSSDNTLKERVSHCDINSINNVVDITNYCMLKWGNPLHAFDEDKIEGNIHIRRAKMQEKFIGIDAKERILNKENLVIADDKKVIALAGVMGAKNTEVTENTKNVLLEAAIFSPLTIRHSRRAAGIDTDSSYRFERQVFADYLEYASQEAANLIEAKCSGAFAGYAEAGVKPKSQDKKITLDLSKLNEYLGMDFAPAKVKNILINLDFTLKQSGRNKFTVVAPKYRFDINREVDVYEEISRIYGYDKIESQIPAIAHEVVKNEIYEFKKELRQLLAGLGLNEIITYSIESDAELSKLGYGNLIKLINPLREQENTLRASLILGMIKAVAYNLNRSRSNLKFFEIANVYSRASLGFCEAPFLSIGASEVEGRDFFYVKGIVCEILKSLNIDNFEFRQKSLAYCANALEVYANGKYLGLIGKLDEKMKDEFGLKKTLFFAELDIVNLLSGKKLKKYCAISPYPAASRDISLVISAERNFSDIEKIINEKKEYICDYKIIDIYQGKDLPQLSKAFSLRIFYQSGLRTLTSEEVDQVNNAIRQKLGATEGIKLR